jgi:hypothetical protein
LLLGGFWEKNLRKDFNDELLEPKCLSSLSFQNKA